MYDILWDDIFERFYIADESKIRDMNEDDFLDDPFEEDESFDRWLFELAGIL